MMNKQKIYPRSKDRETVYLKNVVTDPRIIVGDYTMYNDFVNDPVDFQKNNVLYHYPINHDRLIIGKFCSIACGARFLFNSANHSMTSLATYPFPIFFEEWGLDVSHITDAWDNKGDKEYKDKGYSGKNIERPDFQRLLQDIKLGLIKRVIVYKLDRISRSIVDFAKLMELFKQYDVEFVSCTEKFDTSTPMGRAMLNICIVFAQLERESIQMRVQDAFYSRCTKGYYMRGRTPYGFDTEPIVMDGIKTKKLVENAEMDYAELIYQMYAEPSASYGDIMRYFVAHDIKVYDRCRCGIGHRTFDRGSGDSGNGFRSDYEYGASKWSWRSGIGQHLHGCSKRAVSGSNADGRLF